MIVECSEAIHNIPPLSRTRPGLWHYFSCYLPTPTISNRASKYRK